VAEAFTVGTYGIDLVPAARVTQRAFAVATFALSAVVTAGLLIWLGSEAAVGGAAVLVAVDAVVLGLGQYRAQRHENSVDRQYDRIALGNQMLLAWEAVRPDREAPYLGTDALPGESKLARMHYEFFAYTELDNLEYAVEKYRHGYMREPLANRALAHFAGRLEVERFHATVEANYRSAPYSPDTRRLIESMLSDVTPTKDDPDPDVYGTGSAAPHR
jgi:hypothetical protein